MKKSILLVGNLAIDENDTESGKYRGVGGSVYFAGKTVHNLGGEASVLSPFGNDIPKNSLKGLTLLNHSMIGPHPVVFRNINTENGERKQKAIIKKGSNDYEMDSSLEKLSSSSDAVIICPIIDNLTASDITKIKKRFPKSLYVLLPQGLLRTVDVNGNVRPKEITNEKNLIPLFDAIIYSDRDMSDPYEKAKRWSSHISTVIVTEEKKGCSVYHKGRLNHVPAFKVNTIADSTGSGDIFAGAFVLGFVKNRDMVSALNLAHAAAGFSLRFLPNELNYTIEDLKGFGKFQNRIISL
ncbi:hypothetical protein A3D77_06565 [Candidatus Gottesmanbacteria bacterium RIFCSPHIGHO2_02_FULL_39_11]|uniref:Carbohydrate kinase PfkB domain-containing protein n=1 Tax=Candidatus Gottesmanbacteria bacterium RIFCSPHIGHO2_02_FULL_39_11 TaxID=1798382 RepID=A0A1F5ZSY4_9BACT|nr:MAG: hypothetical protein A3D77_06565 [Candidatus Gottesmanbacteria bacterium RIFCSPHIGHO2_02_FULL_39_11]